MVIMKRCPCYKLLEATMARAAKASAIDIIPLAASVRISHLALSLSGALFHTSAAAIFSLFTSGGL